LITGTRGKQKKKLVKSDASLPGRAGSGPRNNNHEHARAHVGDLFLAFRVRVVVGRRRSGYEMGLGSLGSAGVPGDMALDAQKQIGRPPVLTDDQQQAAIERACMLLARIPDLGVRIN
jgi:hypothetical protein